MLMAELVSWRRQSARAEGFTAELPTYPGGPVLLLKVSLSRVDQLWHASVESRDSMDFGLTRQAPSPFAVRRLAQDWAEAEAEALAAGMIPFPPPGPGDGEGR